MLLPASSKCRGAAGACDNSEYCTGSSAACPAGACAVCACGSHSTRPHACVCACLRYGVGCGQLVSRVGWCVRRRRAVQWYAFCRTHASRSPTLCVGVSQQCPSNAYVSNGTLCAAAVGPVRWWCNRGGAGVDREHSATRTNTALGACAHARTHLFSPATHTARLRRAPSTCSSRARRSVVRRRAARCVTCQSTAPVRACVSCVRDCMW
jgi:hypothetical protein